MLIAVLLATGGCAEAFRGPQVVSFEDQSFYVRSVPVLTAADTAERLPAEICGRVGKVPAARGTDQVYLFDIAYAAYRCVPGPTDRPAASS
ncbi:MAG: hypothetical protein ACFCUO_11780 [Rhodospirillales bacterium]